MTDREIYSRTLPITLIRLLIMLAGGAVGLLFPALTFLATQNNERLCLTATGIAAVVGLIAFVLISRYIAYLYSAAHVAMITEGVTKGELPDSPIQAGKQEVKERFATASLYYAMNAAIRGITSQLTRGITGAASALGGLVGGDSGRSVGGGIGEAISSVVSVILYYVNLCCLGWVFFNKEQNAFKSTLDGAVIYFQNWKTLLKNTAKVILITLLSLVVVGAPLAVLAHWMLGGISSFAGIAREMGKAFETDGATMLWAISGIIALFVWSFLHSAFVKPYILIGVLRKYIEAGQANPPTVDLYGKLCGLSSSFKKTYEKAQAAQGQPETQNAEA